MQQLQSARIVTLRRVWADYQLTRKLKPATVRNYNQRINQHLKDWLDIPITEITKDMVERRHAEITGHAMANSTMRTLRALLHYASFKYEDNHGAPILKANPVRRLSELRAWHRDRRRKSVIHPQQLKPWFQAVFSLDNSTTRDLLLLIIFTGLRRNEAMTLRWENVDLESGTITVDTKTEAECTIPLSSYVWKLLAMRKQFAVSDWVFPGKTKDRHISTGHKAVEAVTARSGVPFCLHDLRRTFVTIGDDLDLKTEVVKALVNHKSSDITESYTIRSIQRLRRATEKITEAIIRYAELR